ncbi:MAG TPA: hypothetical protein VFF73_12320 [Planctomycetota bacterium]|nr:hypothetical protein [Planctomycetota bacterium]
MIGALLCIASILFVQRMASRGLGTAIGAVLLVGYAYGIVRARVNDAFSHFVFDAAMLALYAGQFGRSGRASTDRSRAVMPWVILLITWPVFVFCAPLQHVFIQLVGLRAAVFFLPLILLGSRCEREDVDTVSRWLVVLNLVAFSFAVAEYFIGLEPFYPRNLVTLIIYRSHDIGAMGSHRIPGTFANAHSYAGTMVGTLPFLLVRWQSDSGPRKFLASCSIVATSFAVFMAGARLPVVILFLELGLVLFALRLTPRMKASIAAFGCIVAWLVAQSERFQRFLTLQDTEAVAERVSGSINMGFFEMLLNYPLGGGLGSAAGTSIPYFLAEFQSGPQIGMENEYGRIALEQSIVGLALWLGFVTKTVTHRWAPVSREWALGTKIMRVCVAATWAASFIGTGTLTSIPGTAVLLFEMGLLWRESAARPSLTSVPRERPSQVPPGDALDRPARRPHLATEHPYG